MRRFDDIDQPPPEKHKQPSLVAPVKVHRIEVFSRFEASAVVVAATLFFAAWVIGTIRGVW